MDDEKIRNIAIALLALTALVLFLFKRQGGQVQLGGFVALAVILAITLVIPLAGLALAVPVAAVTWFDHQKEIWGWWEGVKGATLDIGGKKT